MDTAERPDSGFSQGAEDRLIAGLLDRLAVERPLTGWCAELGAWDGLHLSNTAALIRQRGYRAVMIEADPERAAGIAGNHPGSEVHVVQRMVGTSGDDGLDAALAPTPIPTRFDLLSIDVDGCDFWIFDALTHYRPAIVVIEFNPTIPNEVLFVQEPDLAVKQGASARAIVELAARKGYGLVGATPVNLLLAERADLMALTGRPQGLELEEVRDDSRVRVLAFSGYDGTIHLSRPLRLPWHGLTVEASALQALPVEHRIYPGDFSDDQRRAFAEYKESTAGTAVDDA